MEAVDIQRTKRLLLGTKTLKICPRYQHNIHIKKIKKSVNECIELFP